MTKKILLSILPVYLLLATASVKAANTNAIKQAVESMRKGDYAIAYCIMRPMAEYGDAEAQYNIGWMYLNGYGLRIDDAQALAWWEKASSQGHGDASFSIGMLYSLGDGNVSRDQDKAIDYYLLALKHGHDDALSILQSMMTRNEPAMRRRLHKIINSQGELFGTRRQVKASKLNARNGPGLKDKIVTQLKQGQVVLEISKHGKWSQVVVIEDESIDQVVWVYNPLLENDN